MNQIIDPPIRKAFFWPCIVGVLVAIGSVPMLCFGVVCLAFDVDDDPQHDSCGSGGTGGGITMIVMSSFIIGYLMGLLTAQCKLDAT